MSRQSIIANNFHMLLQTVTRGGELVNSAYLPDCREVCRSYALAVSPTCPGVALK